MPFQARRRWWLQRLRRPTRWSVLQAPSRKPPPLCQNSCVEPAAVLQVFKARDKHAPRPRKRRVFGTYRRIPLSFGGACFINIAQIFNSLGIESELPLALVLACCRSQRGESTAEVEDATVGEVSGPLLSVNTKAKRLESEKRARWIVSSDEPRDHQAASLKSLWSPLLRHDAADILFPTRVGSMVRYEELLPVYRMMFASSLGCRSLVIFRGLAW